MTLVGSIVESKGQEYGGQWGANARDVAQKTIIDTCKLRIAFRFEFIVDTVRKTHKSDLQMLDVGLHCAHFYSSYADQVDSVMYRERQRKGQDRGVDLYSWLGRNEQGRYEEVYVDYPQKNVVMVATRFFSVDYIYTLPKTAYDWICSYIENRTILGYNCMKASIRLWGRKWDVWYTPEIAVGYGPWKFHGLPGLILMAEDSEGLFRWCAEGLEQPRNSYLYTYKAYEKSPRIKYRDIFKLHEKKWKDPIGFCLQHGIQVTVPDETGKNWHTGVAGEYSLPYMPPIELE